MPRASSRSSRMAILTSAAAASAAATASGSVPALRRAGTAGGAAPATARRGAAGRRRGGRAPGVVARHRPPRDSRPRPPQLRFRRPLGREVADDRGHLVGPARGDPGLELAGSAGQVQGDVEGLEVTGLQGGSRRGEGRRPGLAHQTLVEAPVGDAVHGRLGTPRLAAVRLDVPAVVRETDHPVGDGFDQRALAPFALAVEADQEGDRDRRGREVPGRDEDRPDVIGDVGDAADDVDGQRRHEHDARDQHGQQVAARSRGRDHPATEDHDGGHGREREAPVEPVLLSVTSGRLVE